MSFAAPLLVADPLLHAVLRAALASLFALAAVHKVRAPRVFVATLRNYRLLPSWSAAPAAVLLIAAEGAVALCLALGAASGARGALLLLATYSAAIGANLLRGRRDVDCGCLGPQRRQMLSGWLLLRNGLLFAAVLPLLAAPTVRPLGWLDAVSFVAALVSFALLWASANRLLETWPHVRALRWQP